MAKKVVAINGFGRIGRHVFRRIIASRGDLVVAAINDLTDTKTLAHLINHDSIYKLGEYEKEFGYSDDTIFIQTDLGKTDFKVFAEKDPEKLPWKELGIDIVIECTGLFTDYEGAKKHIKAGAKKVIISAPAKEKTTPGFVLGVNVDEFDSSKVDIMDMGSCTTNCVAPISKVLNDNFKIVKGFMTTIHSYTNDQKILDAPHKDLRRSRAAGVNMIPTSTGAAKAIGKMIPELDGKLDGISVRVPTPTVSLLDLIVEVEKSVSKEEVNEAFRKAAKGDMRGILRVEDRPLVSSDFIGDCYSAIVDSEETMVNKNMIKVIAWYDNEWGYSCRLAEFAEFVGGKM